MYVKWRCALESAVRFGALCTHVHSFAAWLIGSAEQPYEQHTEVNGLGHLSQSRRV